MFAGSETRSRVSATPAAIAARSAWPPSSAPTIVSASSVGFWFGFIVVRYRSKRYARSVAPCASRAAAASSGSARPSRPVRSTVTPVSPLVISFAAIAPPIFSNAAASALPGSPRPTTRMRPAGEPAGARTSTTLATSPSNRAAAIARATWPAVAASSAAAAPASGAPLAARTTIAPVASAGKVAA